MIGISWSDANKYAEWAGKRLPTEAEWEYAARGGLTDMDYPNGNKWTKVKPKQDSTSWNNLIDPVEKHEPNRFGLYDMGGNVAEWCLDVYDKNAYLHHDNLNPVSNKTGSSHTVRGGSFVDNRSSLRCTARSGLLKFMKSNHTGFRLIRKENFQSQ